MSFKCKEDCGECCGIIPISPALARKTEHFAQVEPKEVLEYKGNLYPITKDGKCIYLNRETKECSIYDERPKICRMFGLTSATPCPYLREDGTKRNKKEVKEIKRQNALTVKKILNLAGKRWANK